MGVWDLAGTPVPRVLTGHHGTVWAVTVSADGRTAVSGGYDGTVRVWDLADGRHYTRGPAVGIGIFWRNRMTVRVRIGRHVGRQGLAAITVQRASPPIGCYVP